jgi:hypothetical protein
MTQPATARHARLHEEFLERDAVVRTMLRWGYAIDRQDWAAVETCTAPDLRAEMWLRGAQVVSVAGRDLYLGTAGEMFRQGLSASLHTYANAFDVALDGDSAHARWPGAIANAFGDHAPERGEGLADAWFVRDDSSPTGWRATRIVFRYVWGYDRLLSLMGRDG